MNNHIGELIECLGKLEEIKKFPVVQSHSNLDKAILQTQSLFGQTLQDFLTNDGTGLTPDEIGHARAGEKIATIKLIRERLAIGLGEAQEMVNKWLKENNIDPFGGLTPS